MIACLFDIDGTLITSGGAGGYALMGAFSDLFGIESPQSVAFCGRTDRGIVTDLFAAHGIENSVKNWDRLREEYLRRLPVELPRRQGGVLPGVQELVEHLAERTDVALGLLTGNLRRGAELKLTHYQLQPFFAFGGFGDHHHHRNDVANEAIEALESHLDEGIAYDSVWVIGDTPLDIECARSVGAKVVAVTTGMVDAEELARHHPDLLLDDLSDVERVLSTIA
ncbi:MAG TPA: haloacid dehalogenase [Planctomycetaceae bacterium]|nr:haloacid dehalogenase [Blastopirellula sp.]HAY82124.1 haloacid dehalogenase [Planctomycetaceae bacterium]